MSRWIAEKEDGGYLVTLADMDQCKHIYNEVCCNDKSEACCDYPDEEECKTCPLFEKEDGICE